MAELKKQKEAEEIRELVEQLDRIETKLLTARREVINDVSRTLEVLQMGRY